MPLFVFIGHDGPDGAERRQAHRAGHVAYLEKRHREGLLVFGGPMRDASDRSVGAVLVFDVADLAAARALVEQDPYVAGGVYRQYAVSRFVRAFPK